MIVHADVDAFFASVERRDDARYRGRPVVVAAEVVACASYEARAVGIRAGMPLARVRRRWPAVLVAPPREEAYARASEELFALLSRYTPLVEPGSMEEAFLDVTGRGDPVELAGALRHAARHELGLPVSVGVARTKLLAKIASRRAKPDGLVVITAEEEERLRPALRVADLWGVGPTTVSRLHAAGLLTVADLARHDEAALRRIVPTAMARRLDAIARGTDDATVRLPGPRRSVQAERTISPPTHSRSRVLGVLRAVSTRAVERLEGDPRRPRRMEVVVRFDDGTSMRHGRAFAAGATVASEAERLLDESAALADGRGIGLVRVALLLPQSRELPGQQALPIGSEKSSGCDVERDRGAPT